MGIVKEGKFVPFNKKGEIKLETIGAVEATSPLPLDVTKYEGKVIMVGGDLQGDILYQSEVVDEAGPILSAVVLETFGKRSGL